jgi:hypothetical protein
MITVDRLLLILSALVIPGVTPACAQASRHGFWMNLGLGYGSARFSCDTCIGSQRLGGWTLSTELGGTLNPHVRLGAEGRVWLNGLKAGKKLPGVVTGTIVLDFYPRQRSGLFLEMGGGLSAYALGKGTGDPIEPYSRDTSYYSGTGWGLTLGVGWEVHKGRGAFRPHIAYHYGAVRRLHSPNGAIVVTGWKQSLLSVELGFLIP